MSAPLLKLALWCCPQVACPSPAAPSLTELSSMATRMVLPAAAALESSDDLVMSVETALGGSALRKCTLLQGSSRCGVQDLLTC